MSKLFEEPEEEEEEAEESEADPIEAEPAEASLAELRSLRRDPPPQTRARYVQYEIFVRAKNLAASTGRPFAETFAEAFRNRFEKII